MPGEILAERYRVIRFIARGGMGEVYEVEDLTLHGRVALKTIRAEIASNPVAVERFRREINIARRITHPNVSRVFDVGVHRGPTNTMFLTMELLSGETLTACLNRQGRLNEREAYPIAEQIALGLSAAHDAGIIHRDFKSPNVMLVPTARGVRAVVTDFGLARPASSEESMASLSELGAVVGTPAYMAPEQVEGRELTPGADLYAFGIVLYEMVTGSRPFTGDSPLSVAVKRLTDRPVPPRDLNPDLDDAWNASILRCLERDPAARFDSALGVINALSNRHTPTALQLDELRTLAQSAAGGSTSRMKRVAFAATAVLMASLTIYAILAQMGARSDSEATSVRVEGSRPPVALRRAVAVLGVRNNTGQADIAWLSSAIAEMLATDFAAGGKIRVASAQEVAQATADFGLGHADTPSTETLRRLGSALNADSIVSGSYTLLSDSRLLRVDLQLVDAATGKVLVSSGASGTEGQLFDVVSRGGGALRRYLGAGELTPEQSLQIEAAIPSNSEAARLYSEGIASLRRFNARTAIDHLTQAATMDPKHPFIHFALSQAYSALGYEVKAKEEAERAVLHSDRLNREQKMQIEARLHETAKDWPKAMAALQSLWKSFPDNVEYGLSLANVQVSGGEIREALVTLSELRKLPEPLSSDGRIDFAEARAYQHAGEFSKQRLLAAKSAARGRADGSRLLVANARLLEASALLDLGDFPATTAATDEARELFGAAGDRAGVARAIELTAWVTGAQGDLEGEKRLWKRALDTYDEIGDARSAARTLFNLGTVLVRQGRAVEAEHYFDDGLSTFRRIGDKGAAATTLNGVGAMMFKRGDLQAAERRYKQALGLYGELNDKTGTAATLSNIGEVLTWRGDLVEAQQMHEESLAINREIGSKEGIAFDLMRLGDIFALRGEAIAARDRYQQSLGISEQMGDKLGAAESQVALAALSIDAGKAADAEAAAREAEELQRSQGAIEQSLFSQAVLVEAMLAQRKNGAALETANRAWQQVAQSEDRRLRTRVGIGRARAVAASGKAADIDAALAFLASLRADASRFSFVIAEYEVRLAHGEIEAAAGRPAAKSGLKLLEKDALARGFARIARHAAAASA